MVSYQSCPETPSSYRVSFHLHLQLFALGKVVNLKKVRLAVNMYIFLAHLY